MNNKSIPVKLMRSGQIGIISHPSSHNHLGKTVIVIGDNLQIVGGSYMDSWEDYRLLDESFRVNLVEVHPPTPKPIEIKVKGCEGCPMWNYDWRSELSVCSHPFNMYDGKQSDEFIEHCPLKERDTVIKYEGPVK